MSKQLQSHIDEVRQKVADARSIHTILTSAAFQNKFYSSSEAVRTKVLAYIKASDRNNLLLWAKDRSKETVRELRERAKELGVAYVCHKTGDQLREEIRKAQEKTA